MDVDPTYELKRYWYNVRFIYQCIEGELEPLFIVARSRTSADNEVARDAKLVDGLYTQSTFSHESPCEPGDDEYIAKVDVVDDDNLDHQEFDPRRYYYSITQSNTVRTKYFVARTQITASVLIHRWMKTHAMPCDSYEFSHIEKCDATETYIYREPLRYHYVIRGFDGQEPLDPTNYVVAKSRESAMRRIKEYEAMDMRFYRYYISKTEKCDLRDFNNFKDDDDLQYYMWYWYKICTIHHQLDDEPELRFIVARSQSDADDKIDQWIKEGRDLITSCAFFKTSRCSLVNSFSSDDPCCIKRYWFNYFYTKNDRTYSECKYVVADTRAFAYRAAREVMNNDTHIRRLEFSHMSPSMEGDAWNNYILPQPRAGTTYDDDPLDGLHRFIFEVKVLALDDGLSVKYVVAESLEDAERQIEQLKQNDAHFISARFLRRIPAKPGDERSYIHPEEASWQRRKPKATRKQRLKRKKLRNINRKYERKYRKLAART